MAALLFYRKNATIVSMDKNHEVEYRALINSETFQDLLNKGKKEFASNFLGPLIIKDAYFCPKQVKDFKEVEMDEVGSYSLRVRSEAKNDQHVVTLNTKTIKNEGDHNAWLENEIDISSYDECIKILETIGFKMFFELKKKRFSFKDGEINVCLEDIENFQPAVEIEILTSSDKTEEAKNKLLNYFAENNIAKESIVKKSITNMLMKEQARF